MILDVLFMKDISHSGQITKQMFKEFVLTDCKLEPITEKDIDVLLAAYNDRDGVTAAFNLNLLDRMNRELGANFRRDAFRHFATYNVFTGAMESYLVSMEAQHVNVQAIDTTFALDAWEPVHTEYSYKYLEAEIAQLASDTGFAIVDRHYDKKHYFEDSLWQRSKRRLVG